MISFGAWAILPLILVSNVAISSLQIKDKEGLAERAVWS